MENYLEVFLKFEVPHGGRFYINHLFGGVFYLDCLLKVFSIHTYIVSGGSLYI